MANFATFRGSRAALITAIREVPRAASGTGPDTTGLAQALLLRGAVAMLSQIQQAFIVKAAGGIGSDGIKWEPLKPATIARRRTTRAEEKALGINKRALNKAQQKVRKETYGRIYAELIARGMPRDDARGRADRIAEVAARKAGRQTRFDALASRKVDILRDTGVLIRSLTPGFEDSPTRPAGQVLQVEPGRIVVGTNVKPWHHFGNPAKNLPKRMYWPDDGRLPDQWWEAVKGAIGRGLVKAVAEATARAERASAGGARR